MGSDDEGARTVRAGDELPWAALEGWIRRELPELPDGFSVLQFQRGRANLTYQVSMGNTTLVVRRQPFGKVAPGAHDMKREHQVLSRLWREFAPAPRAYALCQDTTVVGSDFFVMEFREGVVIGDSIPDELRQHEHLGARTSLALVNAMADLHLVDFEKCGLADLGKPEGFLTRQLEGWQKRWTLASDGLSAEADPVMRFVGRELHRRLPKMQRVSLVHNDLKLDNAQFAASDPDTVKSVFDWDMCTLGDPLLDLGILLSYWPGGRDDQVIADAVPSPSGMELATRRELVDTYAARTGLDTEALDWYVAYARWKRAVIYQQLANRALGGDSRDPRLSAYADRVLPFALEAQLVLERGLD